jgi:hypothetical protein
MKKDLIIVTTHCNTQTKKELLLRLLMQLQKFRDNFDILVSSHIPLDDIFFSYIDFYYFDKNNNVLTDQKYTQNAWFRPSKNYVVWSSYADYGNTMLAIWDMIIPSIQIAKSHGYQKAHYIEYDTFFQNDIELLDNSKLLNEYDYIFYNSKNTHALVGAYFAFRIDSIIEEWEKIDHDNVKKIIESSYPKAPEHLFHKMITTQKKYLKKNLSVLTDSGVAINMSRGSKIYWQVPFYEPETNKLKFILWNNNNESYFTKVIVNNTLLHHFNPIGHNNWKMIDLLDNFDDVQTIKVFRNDKIVLDLNFPDKKTKHNFKYYNSALSEESITPPKI